MKVVFLGFYHRSKDPRLYYRQIKLLTDKIEGIKIYFAKVANVVPLNIHGEFHGLSGERSPFQSTRASGLKSIVFKIIDELHIRFSRLVHRPILLIRMCKLKPDVIQASDAREIPFALIAKALTGCKVIYDSHEDYPRQIIDYSKIKLVGSIRAVPVRIYELGFIRFFDAVFCTDDYLFEKYSGSRYGCKSVDMLRNFPIFEQSAYEANKSRVFEHKKKLELVYIGGVNRYRGVIDLAKYAQRYNRESASHQRSVRVTVFSPENEIVKSLLDKQLIAHYSWIDFETLKYRLREFDVGVCLWLDIPKFRRNLPLKNFDYMAIGLPILTSNFGNLKRYAIRSKAAICIDPYDYHQFKIAVDKLFNPEVRKKLSSNGLEYIRNEASFQNEAKGYVSTIRRFIAS